MADFSARGRARVIVGSITSTAFCVAAALFVDSFNFSLLSEAARTRSIATDISLPILLAGPLTFYFLTKLRELALAKKTLETTLGAMAQGLSFFDANSRLAVWNERYGELFEMSPAELAKGTPFSAILASQKRLGNFTGTAAELENDILQRIARAEPFGNQTRLASGRLIWSMHMPAPDGGWVATHDDVTQEHAQGQLLTTQKMQLEAVLDNMRQGISMFDGTGKLVASNPQFEEIYGLTTGLVASGTTDLDVRRHLENIGLGVTNPTAVSRQQGHAARNESHEQTIQLQDGRFVRVVTSHMADGGFVSTHEDVTERRAIEAQIEHDATHDMLTGAPNRRYLERELRRRQADCKANSRKLGLLHIDLDRFKHVNDTKGHAVGDAMLVHAAQLIAGCAGDRDFVARIGGDEFVVVTSYHGTRSHLTRLAKRIVMKMRRPVAHAGDEYRMGASVGVAFEAPPDIDVERLMVSADLALYRAKTNGRGRFEVYDRSMRLQLAATKQMADQMALGLERGEFIPHFQPKVDARSRAVVGVEALARWQHPERGMIGPSEFLPLAEDLGLIDQIDHAILRQTVDQIAEWRSAGLMAPAASVNVSALRLKDPFLIKQLSQVGFPTGMISFELVESIYLDEVDDVVAWNIDHIRELGVGVEIDDFGTGRASLLALLRLRPDKLKIDRRFIQPLPGSHSELRLVTWILNIAHSMGIKVVAEGVENLEQADLLTELGCDELQGYYFGQPASGVELAQRLGRDQARTQLEAVASASQMA